MKYLAYFFWLAILTGINFGIFANLRLFDTVPNLLFLFVILSASLKTDLFERLSVAFLAGLFADFWSGGFFGGFTLAFLCVVLVLEGFRSAFSLMEMDWKYFFGVCFGAYILVDLLLWTYNFLAFRVGWTEFYVALSGIVRKWPAGIFYNSILLYPLRKYYLLTQDLNRRYLEIGSRQE